MRRLLSGALYAARLGKLEEESRRRARAKIDLDVALDVVAARHTILGIMATGAFETDSELHWLSGVCSDGEVFLLCLVCIPFVGG